MRSRIPALLEIANKDGQYRSNKSHHSKQPEAIEKCEDVGLLLHDRVDLCHSADRGIGGGVAVVDQAIRNPFQIRR